MARIFLSHSSTNNAEAVALRDWLVAQGWDDLFLDLDPDRGIAAGERWERALNEAANRCEAVLFLVTRAWVLAVRHFMDRFPGTQSAEEFMAHSQRLFDPGVMLTHYTREALLSEAARREYVARDLEPIPVAATAARTPSGNPGSM